jgi:hypothetical protein
MISLDNELLKKIRNAFEEGFINRHNELILIPETNLYFLLTDVENELDLKCKVLEWCSRSASKGKPYEKDYLNERYQDEILWKINNILETNFTKEQMLNIYTYLGNGIHRDRTIKFIESNYNDYDILKGETK